MSQTALESAVHRLQGGETAAFEYIYDQTYKVVYFVAHEVLRDKHAAEDVVHDAYIAAYRNIASYTSNSFLAWITTIARRLAINQLKQRGRSVSVDFTNNGEYLGGKTEMPDDNTLGLIALAEELLNPQDFKIVVLCAVSGYKRREVAKIMNMPISTITHRYTQALKKLEKKLNGEERK